MVLRLPLLIYHPLDKMADVSTHPTLSSVAVLTLAVVLGKTETMGTVYCTAHDNSARSSFFTLYPRIYTLTSGNKLTTHFVTVDQFTSSHTARYRPVSELKFAEAIWFVGDIWMQMKKDNRTELALIYLVHVVSEKVIKYSRRKSWIRPVAGILKRGGGGGVTAKAKTRF